MQRRTAVLSIVLVLAFFAAGAILVGRLLIGSYVPFVSEAKIAILPVTGIIDSDRALLRQLERYRDDGSVRGFVIEIRSPGGMAAPAQALYMELLKLREEDDRPIVAWIGEIGASGGYFVALASDSVLALPGSITGSIGVIMEFPNAQQLLRKVGVELEVVKSGDLKDLGSPVRELTDQEREVLQEVVDDVYWQFVEAVEENRELGREEILSLADGRIFSGQRAVDLGLVDRVGTLAEAIAVAGRMAGLGDRPKTVRPMERRVGFFELLRGIEESRLLGWVRGLASGAGTPQLRYQWR